MWIREVELKNFGKFRDKKMVLSPGINVVYGENESGKSTIYTAIKALFFGMSRGRGRAAKNDLFRLYEPWDEGNYYAGKLRFVCDGKSFSLERNFDKYGKNVRLFCEDDGEELSVESGDLQMLLDEMDEAKFENTVSIGQMKVETDSRLADVMKNYAANYFATGDDEINLTKALGILKERKKEVEKEIRQLHRKKQEKRDKLELETSYVWKDLRSLENEKDALLQEMDSNQQRIDDLDDKERKEQELLEERGHRWTVHPGIIFGMLLVVVLTFFMLPRPWNYIITVVVALAEILFVWNQLKDSRRKQAAVREEERGELEEVSERQKWQMERLKEEYQDKQTLYLNLKEQLDELDELGEDFKVQEQRRKALELAEEVMISSSREMQVQLEGRINERVSEIFCELTSGKYDKVWVDDQLHISIYSEGRKISLEQVSRGTIEQLYFSLRMAVVEITHTETYPIILDDAFVFYDDIRLESVLKWLQRNQKQVILFTCQNREEEIMRKTHIAFHKIAI